MGFIIVGKNTGDIIKNKIYKTESSANSVITKSKSLQKFAWVVIPMPSAEIIKKVHDGHNYATSVFLGFIMHTPNWDDEEDRYDEWGNEL